MLNLFVLLFSASLSQASLLEIEKQCNLMYQGKHAKKKIKDTCFCVTINIRDRFTTQQIEDLTRIYSKKMGRFEASKDDSLKAMSEFDYFTHSNCLKNPGWRYPKDDLGHPDDL